MADVDLQYAIGLTPKDAVAYFETKGLQISGDWHEVWREAHAKAFTVANLAKMDVLQDIQAGIHQALTDGKTERWFDQTLTPILQAKGWWGKAVDESTGEITQTYPGTSRPVQYGSPRRLRLIYRQNLQSAYMAGRWKAQAENADHRPYLQYVAVMDSRTRPAHKALNGQVYRLDDPVWQYLYPPNGWNCRCRVRALTERQVRDKGLMVESGNGRLDSTNVVVGRDDAGNDITRPVTRLRYTDPVDGREKYFQPDAGWDYNPGRESFADIALWNAVDTVFNPEVRDGVLAGIVLSQEKMQAFNDWIDKALAHGRKDGSTIVLGYMAETERQYMAALGKIAMTGVILLEDRLVVGAKADRHMRAGNALSVDEWKTVPAGMAEPEATIYDTNNGTLIYVFSSQDDRKIKLVVEVGRLKSKVKHSSEVTRTVFKVLADDLRGGVKGGQYKLIRGSIG